MFRLSKYADNYIMSSTSRRDATEEAERPNLESRMACQRATLKVAQRESSMNNAAASRKHLDRCT